ncbi:MAG: class I SAM-dependent methyltransferase [Acidimicrobiia bacterium]|nr:class I SAM-dependent methyltransferase [Acidimicrobiia bacterium]
MDKATFDYYEQNADFCTQRWNAIERNTEASRLLSAAFPVGGRILDVGCGSGRDLAVLRDAGFETFGVEPVESFRTHLIERRPEFEPFVAEGSLPELNLPALWPATFDGIVCSAVLMHLSSEELVVAMSRLREILAVRGRLLVSVPAERPGIVNGRDSAGRLFSGVRARELEAIAVDAGLGRVDVWSDWADLQGREGYSWDALLLERSDET